MNRRVAVRAIIVHDGKLLCVRLKQYEGKTTESNNYWCTPGGGVDPGEALIPALRREIIEELGPEPRVEDLLYVQQFVHNGTEHLEFFFHVTNTDDYVNLDLAKTTHGMLEIDTVDFVDPTRENVLPKFLTTEPIGTMIARPQPPKFFDYIN